jgi:hypothetical protein
MYMYMICCIDSIFCIFQSIIPGPPFAFGTVLVIIAMLVAINIPDNPHAKKPMSKSALQIHQSKIEQGMCVCAIFILF